MHHAALLVQMPDALRHLDDDVAGQSLAKVGELYDLMEQLATFHDCMTSAHTRGPSSGQHAMGALTFQD